ncbi:hypothetical protein SAMN02949497_1547 [Methylomagnum ishizawai]|uniref:Uncharacterized protein n=1 Tax=Methylomagnum ishizawai TaxID=1760988 RepID=A0A1Y6CUD7_9GAMM|nr:hypothetical protein [Methylomagnum ishizawai]SMF94238.1 hypothetical protein SAMN02949497_1547 [Methylomagnum ishizawai]
MKLNTIMMAGLILCVGLAREAGAQCSAVGGETSAGSGVCTLGEGNCWIRYTSTGSSLINALSGRFVCGTGTGASSTGSNTNGTPGAITGTWHEYHNANGNIIEQHSNTTADPADPDNSPIGTWAFVNIPGPGNPGATVKYTYGTLTMTYIVYGNTPSQGTSSSSTKLSFCTAANGTELVVANVFNGKPSGDISNCSP